MDLISTGDIHLGGNRPETCRRVMDFVAEEADRRAVAAVICSGDWHHARSTEIDRLYGMELLRWGTRRRPWVIIGGNHDVEHDIEILPRFATDYPVHVFDTPGATTVATPHGPLLVACLSDLRGRLLARRMDQMHKGATASEAARVVLDELGEELAMLAELGESDGARVPRLFVGHLTLGSALMDNDQPARGADITWALDELRAVAADAYALGHIHLRQSWLLDGRPVFYPGAPYATTYGDLGPRSITILHWTGDRFDVEHVPTPAPRLVHLVGTWRREGAVAEMRLSYDKAHATDLEVVAADLAGADVRLQYPIPLDDKAAAERAAADHTAAILAAGAVKCEPDARPAAVARTRTHALASARTTTEKVLAYWTASNTTPEPERRARVLAHIARLEPMAPPEPPVSLVRVDALEWASVGPLGAGRLTLPAGLWSVTGPNRAGKSTLLSLATSGLWIDGPRGSLDRLGKKAGARVKLAVTTPAGSWTVEQKIPSRRCEVRDDAEEPVPAFTRDPYYEWAEKVIPSKEVLGQVCFLKDASLLDLIDAKLKDALLVLGGSSKFPVLAKLVRDELSVADARRESALSAIVAAGDPGGALAATTAKLDAARAATDSLTADRAALAKSIALASERQRLDGLARAAGLRLSTEQARLDTLVAAQGDAALIRAAAATHAAAKTALADAEAEGRRVASEIASLRRSIAELAEERGRAVARAADTTARAARLETRLAARPDMEAAVLAQPEARARLLAAEAAVSLAAQATGSDGLRTTLGTIRDTASSARLKQSIRTMDPALVRIRDLASDALSAGGATKAPLASVMSVRDAAARAVADLEQKARALADMEATAAELVLTAAALEDEGVIAMLLGAREADLAESLPALEVERGGAGKRWSEAAALVRKHAPMAARLADVDRADGAIAAIQGQIATLAREHADAIAALETFEARFTQEGGAALPPPSQDRQAQIDRNITAAIRESARLEEICAYHQRGVDRIAAEREKLTAAERDHGDLTETLRVLDRDAIQAYEATEVGESIADDATELLQRHGFRWSLRFDATRPTKAKRFVEQARWTIVDASGEEYDARARGGGASDGEEVIAATAIFFGAAMGVARAGGGVPDATLSIDERTGAIRGPLVEQWLAMIRDGAARVGARTVLLVPPNDEKLIDACDGVITVTPSDNGSVVAVVER